MKLQDILAKLSEMPEAIRTAVRNNAGGHANHSMFWEIMGPNGGTPDGELFAAITRDFGGLDTLQARFNDGGLRVFGSGWVMVTVAPDGKLALETSPNQDTPISDYLKAWWNVVNWNKIAERYAAAKAGTLAI
jgi:superoxide dismutase, Fe-Mn family